MGSILKLLNFIGSLFSWWRDRGLVKQGKALAEKEIAENNLAELQRREEAVNAEPKTSYDGRPNRVIDWMRRKNADKK